MAALRRSCGATPVCAWHCQGALAQEAPALAPALAPASPPAHGAGAVFHCCCLIGESGFPVGRWARVTELAALHGGSGVSWGCVGSPGSAGGVPAALSQLLSQHRSHCECTVGTGLWALLSSPEEGPGWLWAEGQQCHCHPPAHCQALPHHSPSRCTKKFDISQCIFGVVQHEGLT